MIADALGMTLYTVPLIFIWAYYVWRGHRRHVEGLETFEQNREAGLLDPASLHPIVDQNKCIGCGSCVAACPEMPAHQVIGMVRRKAQLVSPTDCIGHGACKAACPVDAITLVFGTARRGVDIPIIKPNFESNVPGIFIAGELGGMGLIRNAIEQGRQALAEIAKTLGNHTELLDVIIVGAGPAGISASLAAKERGLKFVTIEQDSLGGTVASFPRRKLVMTSPATLPLVGRVKFTETTKEALLEFWCEVEGKTGLTINYGERLESVSSADGALDITTTKGKYRGRALLLAVGRRGTPRKLGVPGEGLNKVTYRFIDAEQYQNQHVLIVGGGDSALESALAIGEQPGTTVTLSYRSAAFSRAKKKNRERLAQAAESNQIRVLLESTVSSICDRHVEIDWRGEMLRIENDAVIINAGGILPTAFLKEIGIEVETKHGVA